MFNLKLPFRPDLVCCDVDGTLMNDEYIVTQKTQQTIEQLLALEDGPDFVICTGRHLATLSKTVLPIFQKLNPRALHVVCGGAMVIDSFGKILWKEVMEVTLVKEICQQVESLGGGYGFGNGESFYCEREMLDRRLASLGAEKGVIDFRLANDIEQPEQWETSLIVINKLNPQVISYVQALAEKHGFSLKEMTSTRTGLPYFDLTLPNINKSNGIKKMLELKGEPTELVMMLGDGMNDLEAVTDYFGVAVANAKDDLKAVADLILPWTNDQDAVANFLLALMAAIA
jgi:hypothetical protein